MSLIPTPTNARQQSFSMAQMGPKKGMADRMRGFMGGTARPKNVLKVSDSVELISEESPPDKEGVTTFE